MNTTPDHPDFTALALGEHIHGTPARAVLDAMRTSVVARQEAEMLRETAAKLSLVLKGQAPLRLDAKRRNAIFNADITALKERFAAEEREEEEGGLEEFMPVTRPRPARRRTPAWIFPSVAAAAVVAGAVAVLQLLPGHQRNQSTRPPVAGTGTDSGPRLIVSTPPATPPRGKSPAETMLPPAVTPPQDDTMPREQQTVSTAPAVPAIDEIREDEAPPSLTIPEVPPTKPPPRADFRDYASPPRIPNKK